MPQVKTRGSTKTRKRASPAKQAAPSGPEPTNVRDLIGKMLDYEATARENGIDFASSRFKKLTASERDFLRAELIADYIRLSAGNTGKTPGYYDATLISFCSKICDMGVPSGELIGTYLAAVDVVSSKNIDWLKDAVRGTIVEVLQTCVRIIEKKTQHTAEVST